MKKYFMILDLVNLNSLIELGEKVNKNEQEKKEKAQEKELQKLQEKYGTNFDQNVSLANSVSHEYGDEKDRINAQSLMKSDFFGKFIRAFSKNWKKYSDFKLNYWAKTRYFELFHPSKL